MESSNEVSVNEQPTTANNDEVVETGSIYISGRTITDNVKIPTTNPHCGPMTSSIHIQVSASDCDHNGQPEVARLMPKQAYFHFRVSITVEIPWTHFYRTCHSQKLQICRWNFDPIYHKYQNGQYSLIRAMKRQPPAFIIADKVNRLSLLTTDIFKPCPR